MIGSGKSGQFIIFLLVFISVIGGIAVTNKPKRVLFAIMAMVMPWQGGFWIQAVDIETKYAYFLVFGLLFLGFSATPRIRTNDRLFPILVSLLLMLFAWALVSAAGAINASFAVGGAITILLDLAILVAVVRFVQSESDFRFAIKCIIAALIFECVLAVLQYKIRGFTLGVIDARRWKFFRTSGTLLHPNMFGMYICMILPMVFRETLGYFNAKNGKKMLQGLIFFLVAGFVLYTTKNRGSWVGFSFGLFITISYDFLRRGQQGRKLRRIIMQTMGALAIVVSIAMIRYGDRIYERMFESNAEHNWDRRQMLVENAYPIIEANPLHGVGMRNYMEHVDTEFVHNMYLMIAAEIGIPGLVMFCLLFLIFIAYSFKVMRSKIVTISNYGSGFMAVVLGVVVSSIAGPDLFVSHGVRMHFWVLCGLLIGLSRLNDKMKRMKRPGPNVGKVRQKKRIPQRLQIAHPNPAQTPGGNSYQSNTNGSKNFRYGG